MFSSCKRIELCVHHGIGPFCCLLLDKLEQQFQNACFLQSRSLSLPSSSGHLMDLFVLMCEVKEHALGLFGGMLSLCRVTTHTLGRALRHVTCFTLTYLRLYASWMVQYSCFQMFNVPLDGIVNPHIFGGQSMKAISNNCIFNKSKLKHIYMVV